jgi:predicted transcriptional regulator
MMERPDLRVVVRILEALWRLGGPLRPTRLQQASGTNYTQFARYLAHLEARGLVATSTGPDGETEVRLTPRGEEALRFLTAGLDRLLGAPPGAPGSGTSGHATGSSSASRSGPDAAGRA